MRKRLGLNLSGIAKRSMSVLVLLVAVSFPAILAQQSDGKTFDALVESAFNHNKANEFELAIRDISEALRLSSKSASLYAFRGAMYVQMQESTKALIDFDEALQLDPNVEGPINGLRGLCLFNLQRWDEAIKSFTEQLKRDQKDFRSLTLRGRAYLEKKENALAISDFTQAILIDAKRSRANTFRAKAYLEMGDSVNAARDASEEIRLNPELAYPFEIRAKAYRKLGRIDLAEVDEKRAKELTGNLK